MGNMYSKSIKQWNPFSGCCFDCSYCRPSFQAQAKRQLHNCRKCYDYAPHIHPERLNTPLPRTDKGEFIFTCASGDISFCPDEFYEKIIKRIKGLPHRTFLLQSKNPAAFTRTLPLPGNVIIGTTIETNRTALAAEVSKAPAPKARYKALKALPHDRKMVTIEPAMEWDYDQMVEWIMDIDPDLIWLGVNSKPRPILKEPSAEQFYALYYALRSDGYQVILKTKL